MNNTPHENMSWGQALAPVALVAAASAVNGPRIIAPAKLGLHLSFLLTAAGMTGVTGFNAEVQGSNDSGTTWTTLLANDGVTKLAFTGARTIAGSPLDGGTLMGTIIPGRSKYVDFRLGNITVTGANASVSSMFIISPLKNVPAQVKYPGGQNVYGQNISSGGQVDELLNLFLPTGAL